MAKTDELLKLKELLDSGVLSQEEFDKEKKKLLSSDDVAEEPRKKGKKAKEYTPEQLKKRKRISIFFIVIILILVAFEIKGCSELKKNKPEAEPVSVYFDALEFVKTENNKQIPLTQDEVIAKLGEPTSQEEWKYELPNGNYYLLNSMTYSIDENTYREFVINIQPDGTRQLVRINLYGTIPYNSRKDFLPMFNLREYKNTEIKDNNISFRAKNTGIYDFWIPSTKDNQIDAVVKLSYFNMPGFSD